MARVYRLKHATNKMKYQHMISVMDFKADLKEKQEAEYERRVQLREQFADALDELKAADPAGWEAWYDDNNNIPEFIEWGKCEPVIANITARVAEMKKAIETAGAHLNWQVLEPATLRAYEQADQDFLRVTGCHMQSATRELGMQWKASMEKRGLNSNTIRQRLSALNTISGIRIQLPVREKREPFHLEGTQIRTMMAVVTDKADRMLLVRLLTLGSQARTLPAADAALLSHVIGAEMEHTLATQKVTRLLRRYARKAGLDPKPINLRVWCLSGRRLMESLSPAEFAKLVGKSESRTALHGIGRRSFAKATS